MVFGIILLMKILNKLPQFIHHLYSTVIVLVGWVFFYYTNLSEGFEVLRTMFGMSNKEFYNFETKLHLTNNIYFIIIAVILSTPLLKNLLIKLLGYFERRKGSALQVNYISPIVNIGLLVIITALLVGKTYNPFLYFRF